MNSSIGDVEFNITKNNETSPEYFRDKENERSLGILSYIMLAVISTALLIIVIFLCYIFIYEKCKKRKRRQNIYDYNSNYNRNLNYNRRSYSPDSEIFSEADENAHDENENMKIDPLIVVKNISFNEMNNCDTISLNEDETCAICLEKITQYIDDEGTMSSVIKTKCNHYFHLECVNTNKISKCPLCREPFQYSKSYSVYLNL